jgi:catechol 2,3-dioxygenase-like lactoylglutathione lyase family enzyme
MVTKATGVHHIAIATGDLRAQLEFFSQVLGMELVALYPMHGVEGVIHAFVKASDTCHVAFAYEKRIADIPIEFGRTHAGFSDQPVAPGAVQHIAFDAPSEAELYAMRDRIRLNGVNVIGPIDHGFCKSIYFAGPEHLTLEVAYSDTPIDGRLWIDAALATEQAGISAEDLARFKAPADMRAPSAVPQPPIDPTKPHMEMPRERYEAMLRIPDDVLLEKFSYATPPVELAEG